MNSRLRSLLQTVASIAVALAAAVACAAPTPTPTATPTPPFGLPPLTLPADESPHDFQAEWWYFNLHLTSDEGQRFALHDVVFQVQQLDSNRTIYVRQIGLTDGESGHLTSERLRSTEAPLEASPGDFSIEIGDGLMSGAGGEAYVLRADVGGYAYNLRLTPTASPLLHGGIGLLDYREAGVTYYYTRPRLDVAGALTTPNGDTLNVAGLAWLDKQWGDFQPVAVEWDWASIQMEDGTDLMFSVVYDHDGSLIESYATLRRPGDETRHLGPAEFAFVPGEAEWRSPRTATTYRVDWRVEIPDEGIALRLRPLETESEFSGTLLPVAYWESGVEVLDAGGAVVGQGFIELNWARGRDR